MKKLISTILVFSCILAFTACDEELTKRIQDETAKNQTQSETLDNSTNNTEDEKENGLGGIFDDIKDGIKDVFSNNSGESDAAVEEATKSKATSYEDILEEYSEKLRNATPILIEEYNNEAANNNEGLSGLATLCNDKVSELATISMDGISEMATFMYTSSSGSYEEYEEWAGKLQDVYMEEAGKIQKAYMDSAK